jgi:hypothetical protein
MDAALSQTLNLLAPLGLFALPLLGVLVIWSIAIKAVALWKAARNGDKAWFLILLLVNTLGILELIYILAIAKKAAPAPVADSSAPVA